MRWRTLLLGLTAVLALALAAYAAPTGVDNDNMQWQKAWMSPDSGEVEVDIPVPRRGDCAGAWYDFDGDGNLEFMFDDNDKARTFVYENAGDNVWEYRWFADYVDATGKNLYDASGDRGVVGTDLDGDGADELILIRSTPGKGKENHIPPIRIYKHQAGSAEFLPMPMEWTVDWDEVPIANADSVFHMEYYNGAGDWDKDGRGEFGLNYKGDPKYYFGIVEVIPPLVPGQVQFRIEHMIEKKTAAHNVALIQGKDLDNDGYDELFLPQRNNVEQVIYYLDCTGPNAWTEYYWGPDDARVVPDSVRVGGTDGINFVDLDKDGIKEMVGIYQAPGLLEPWAQGQSSLWVAKLNPMDPAHLLAKDRFWRLNTMEETIGLGPKKSLSNSEIQVGDVDADGLPDLYWGLGETADPSRLVNAEFVGTDYTNPAHWKYYTIIKSPVDAGLADPVMAILGPKLVLGDGDKDGKADLFHNNRRGSSTTVRPGAYVWEFKVPTLPTKVETHPVADVSTPASFTLMQNYPNPFNPTTTITFTLTKSAPVLLKVFDVQGRLVQTLIDEPRTAGSHHVVWNGRDQHGAPVASGVYFYALSDPSTRVVRKMMLVK